MFTCQCVKLCVHLLVHLSYQCLYFILLSYRPSSDVMPAGLSERDLKPQRLLVMLAAWL